MKQKPFKPWSGWPEGHASEPESVRALRFNAPEIPLDSSLFTWEKWRGGSFYSLFGIRHRRNDIAKHAKRIAQLALGHAKGESLPFRPKPGMYAMMFLTDNGEFWSHITPEEFRLICEAAR